MVLSSKGQHISQKQQGAGASRPLSSIDEIEIPGPAVPVKRHQLALVIRSFMSALRLAKTALCMSQRPPVELRPTSCLYRTTARNIKHRFAQESLNISVWRTLPPPPLYAD